MYTKGEWKVCLYPHGVKGCPVVEAQEGLYTKVVAMINQHEGETEANAKLMALSPRMAELLKQLADWDGEKLSNIKLIEISKSASKIIAELEGKNA